MQEKIHDQPTDLQMEIQTNTQTDRESNMEMCGCIYNTFLGLLDLAEDGAVLFQQQVFFY